MSRKKNFSIDRQLLISVLGVSTLLTFIFTSVSFYLDLVSEDQTLKDIHNKIEVVSLNNLRQSIFDYDLEAVEIQLNSLSNFQEIVGFELKNEKNEQIFQMQLTKTDVLLDNWEFPISMELSEGNTINVGHLTIEYTKIFMYRRLGNKLLYFFTSQGIKTFIVSLILLYIFNRLILCRVKALSESMERFEKSKFLVPSSIKGDLFLKNNDELNYLMTNYMRLSNLVSERITETEKEVKIQKAKVLNAAKMASIGEMAGGIAHEINNPISIISGNNAIIMRDLKKENGKENLLYRSVKIEEMVKRVSSIVTGLRIFARDGSTDPFEDLNVNVVLNDTLSLCKEKFSSKGIILRHTIQNSNMKIRAKHVQFSQALLNILNNAFDALKNTKSPKIEILCRTTEDRNIIEIRNNGPKIPNTICEKILQPFFTTKEIGRGTGLGLSISKGIIENHHGSLDVVQQDEWVSFVISLPLEKTFK